MPAVVAEHRVEIHALIEAHLHPPLHDGPQTGEIGWIVHPDVLNVTLD